MPFLPSTAHEGSSTVPQTSLARLILRTLGPASGQEGRCGPQSLSFPFPGNPRKSDIPCFPGSVVVDPRYDLTV